MFMIKSHSIISLFSRSIRIIVTKLGIFLIYEQNQSSIIKPEPFTKTTTFTIYEWLFDDGKIWSNLDKLGQLKGLVLSIPK